MRTGSRTPKPKPRRTGTLVVALAFISLIACGFEMYSRDVTAQVTGPATVRVGEVIQLAVTLTFSDGTSNPLEPSQISEVIFHSTNTSILTVSEAGEVRGIAPGTATVTATPSVTSTGSGQRTAGTIAITVVP
jgi:Bacterial Ig-like domain (group 2)